MQLQEKIIQLKENGERIISLDRLRKLNDELECPLSEEELDLFLSFQHNAGYMLRFKEAGLEDMLILDPRLVIDAMKCFVTCEKFALNVWGKRKWKRMTTTGEMMDSYVTKIWRRRSKSLYFNNREFLLRVIEKLDIIARPKIYDKGQNIDARFYFVPSMVKEVAKYDKRHRQSDAVTVEFKFNDILPPAVYHRLVCTCLSLWPLHDEELYDAHVELESGLNHLLIIRRQFKTITVSFVNKYSPDDIDMNLCRSVKQYICQSIKRIVSLYDTDSGDGEEELYTLVYNDHAQAKHLHEVILLYIQLYKINIMEI